MGNSLLCTFNHVKVQINRDKGLKTAFIPVTSFLNSLLFFLYIEALAETFYASCGIENALLPGKEWMAL